MKEVGKLWPATRALSMSRTELVTLGCQLVMETPNHDKPSGENVSTTPHYLNSIDPTFKTYETTAHKYECGISCFSDDHICFARYSIQVPIK